MGRRELREHIFLLLFRVEFNTPEDMPEQIRMFFEDDETFFSEKDEAYITEKYHKIIEKKEELDSLLNEKAEGWDVTRMGKIELAVLRLALYEIKFDEDVPAGVAVYEAVELAKKVGHDNLGSFVNAVVAMFL